jgi:D-tyrosyl-tRNA(Tyr) deacylase
MRIVLQRVSRAEVRIQGRVAGRIGPGFLLLVGFTHTDSDGQLTWMADKVAGLRVLGDADGKMNLALADVDGAVLVVSQFTLYGDSVNRRSPCTSGSSSCCASAGCGWKPASSAR